MSAPATPSPADDDGWRPRDLSPEQLGFTPRSRVPWLAPRLLANTAVRAGLAVNFGAYLDKRELQGALPAEVHDHDTDGDLWLDYVADLGDGFNATYSVAWLVAQRELAVKDPEGAEHALPRAQVLVMGGDQVYPTADWRQYEDRCKGPYRAALPEQDSHPPTLYALPGNHDWYDGLTAFLRLFGKGEPFGGWQTAQSRSYFALKLPRRWWLYAIDAQFDAYLDEPQLGYFHEAAKQLQPDDRVILCAARPTWTHTEDAPHEYDTVDYFIRKIVRPKGAVVSVLLAGDTHHYARYQQAGQPTLAAGGEPASSEDNHRERQLITCGGGGAYLAATHRLPESLVVPPKKSLVHHASPRRRYELAARYPDAARSRRYSWSVFLKLPWRNPGFNTLLAGVHTLLLAAYISAGGGVPWFTVPALVMSAVVLVAAVGFAATDRVGGFRRRHLALGGLHGVAHLGLGVAGASLWAWLGLESLPTVVRLVLALAIYAPVIGIVASLLVCLYLQVAHRFGVNVNELYAGQGIEDAKCFLRLRIGRDGALTIYPIAVDEVSRKWRAAPEGPWGAPWVAPEHPIKARLAEPPVRVATRS
ncbi:MAG: metallophosphoesterase [Micromonosporaceae bacterium]|nr:metallophosphoesterase [Micromonosporaceae bacterium]